MREKINSLLQRSLFIYLYGFAFFVFKASAYFASFKLLPFIGCMLVFSVVSYILFLSFQKITNPAYAGIPVMMVWVSLMHVVGIAGLFGYPYAYISASFYVCFYASVLVAIAIACLALRRVPFVHAYMLNKVVNVFLVATSIIFVVTGYQKMTDTRLAVKSHFHSDVIPPNHTNTDIVWILMDEYGSSECLSKQFSFKNPLDSFLREEHFSILNSIHSRFTSTLFSVNSIFNIDDSLIPSNFYEGTDLLRNGSLIPTLENAGYRFVNLGFFDIAQHPMLADRSGYPYKYVQQLISGTVFYMAYSRWKNSIKKCDAYTQDVLQRLNDTLSVSSTQPRFIWAHIPVPHEPFCRNNEGRLLEDSAYAKDDSMVIKRRYIDYLQYGNKVITGILQKHKNLSEKIIIISGDHGPRFPFLKNAGYKNWPFAAVFIPQQYDSLQLQKLGYISQLSGFLVKHVLN